MLLSEPCLPILRKVTFQSRIQNYFEFCFSGVEEVIYIGMKFVSKILFIDFDLDMLYSYFILIHVIFCVKILTHKGRNYIQ